MGRRPSVLILTRNEVENICACIASVGWSDDVVVLDSFSSDDTVGVATASGARVVCRVFDDYASQRNFGLTQIEYKNEWVLMLDADEKVSAELAQEIQTVLDGVSPDVTLFMMRRRDHLFGRCIKRSAGYPTWFGRLVRLGQAWVERPVNEEYKTSGVTGSLRHHLDHFPFSKGLSAWIEKHNRYSTMEARLIFESNGARKFKWSAFLSRDPVERRRAQKAASFHLPCRPALIFVGLYFFRGGILEGMPGLAFCALRAWYEFLIDCKLTELRLKADLLARR